MKKIMVFAMLLVILAAMMMFFGCKDNFDISGINQQGETSLAAADEVSKAEMIEKFKTLKGDELLTYMNSIRKEVVWDGKDKFQPGVSYLVPKELDAKAREMNEGYREGMEMIERARTEREAKKKQLTATQN